MARVRDADASTTATVETLVRDLVAWIGTERAYDEVMDAWRTSCPRLPVWEDAVAGGYVAVSTSPVLGRVVVVTEVGRALLGGTPGGLTAPRPVTPEEPWRARRNVPAGSDPPRCPCPLSR
jgi:hypothetical protein